MQNRLKSCLFLLVLFSLTFSTTKADNIKRYNVGYFEAGQYDIHSILRDEYFKQLEYLLPDSIQLVTIPEGFRSADWNRENSKKMAKQLADIKHLDFILAFGPWVVHDLLEAGFDKPIIGIHQFNPKAEGLLGEDDRPIAENLTVHFRPGKIVDDIRTLMNIIPIKKLGLLYFPSDDTTNNLYSHIKSIGNQFGFEVITASEFDNEGTFAFYKSYDKIRSEKVDALYLPPLWGLDSKDISEFFKLLNREKIPTFTDEGSLLLQHGATGTNNYYGIVSEAFYNAFKTVEIINGATPANLPVVFRSGYNIALNKNSMKKTKVEIRADLFNSYQFFGKDENDNVAISPLHELVNRALSQNPDYLSFEERLSYDETQIEISRTALKPQIYSEADFKYTDKNYRHNYHDIIEKEALKASLHISQNIFSKETLKEIQTNKRLKDISQISKFSEQLDLELAVSFAYMDYLKILEKMKVIQNLRNMLSYNIEILHAKQLVQNADSLDYIRLENYRYTLTLKYIENHRILKTTQIILNSLLNVQPDELFLLQEDYFSESKFIQFESPMITKLFTHSLQEETEELLLNKMLSQNPNQSKADAVIAYNKSILDKTNATFYPELKLQGSLFYDDYQKESNIFKEKRPSWFLGGKITLPLYLGGKRFKEKKLALAGISEAEYKKDAISLVTMKNGLTQYHRFVQFTEQMTPALQAKQRAYSSLTIANNRYNAETFPTTDYLDILKTTFETDISSIEIRYNYFASMAKLVHAMAIPVSDSFSDFVKKFHEELKY